jgi:hypothetical protein
VLLLPLLLMFLLLLLLLLSAVVEPSLVALLFWLLCGPGYQRNRVYGEGHHYN